MTFAWEATADRRVSELTFSAVAAVMPAHQLVDLAVTIALVLTMMALFGYYPIWNTFALPFFILLLVVNAAGVSWSRGLTTCARSTKIAIAG